MFRFCYRIITRRGSSHIQVESRMSTGTLRGQVANFNCFSSQWRGHLGVMHFAWNGKWRQRFATGRLSALSDAPRPATPYLHQNTEKRILALARPAGSSRVVQWNGTLLAEALGGVSSDQVWRIL